MLLFQREKKEKEFVAINVAINKKQIELEKLDALYRAEKEKKQREFDTFARSVHADKEKMLEELAVLQAEKAEAEKPLTAREERVALREKEVEEVKLRQKAKEEELQAQEKENDAKQEALEKMIDDIGSELERQNYLAKVLVTKENEIREAEEVLIKRVADFEAYKADVMKDLERIRQEVVDQEKAIHTERLLIQEEKSKLETEAKHIASKQAQLIAAQKEWQQNAQK